MPFEKLSSKNQLRVEYDFFRNNYPSRESQAIFLTENNKNDLSKISKFLLRAIRIGDFKTFKKLLNAEFLSDSDRIYVVKYNDYKLLHKACEDGMANIAGLLLKSSFLSITEKRQMVQHNSESY